MGRVKLEIFRFNPSIDYDFYFQKIQESYTTNTTLKEILGKIENLAFDNEIALRINGICVLEDVSVSALVKDFGEKIIIEPLSKRYVSKDLSLNKEAMFRRYDEFFKQHSFISDKHKNELYGFLHFNAISLQGNADYLGDGFFLYVRWLLEHYTDHSKELINYISHPKNGVLSYASIQNLLYKPNKKIDENLTWLQENVFKMAQKDKNKAYRAFYSKLSLSKLKSIKSDIKSTDSKFAIFNGYGTKDSISLIKSTKTLLNHLGISFLELKFCYTGGNVAKVANKKQFLLRSAYNLALAKLHDKTLLFADYDSFLEAQFAIKHINENKVNEFLHALGLHYENDVKIAYIGDLINDEFKSKNLEKSKKSVFYSGHNHPCVQNLGVDFIDIIESRQDFCHLEIFNQEYYLKDSARMRFAGIDMGVDFLSISSVAQFRAFDTFAKKAAKALGRDPDSTPVLFLPQIALLALGENNKKALGLNHHKLR